MASVQQMMRAMETRYGSLQQPDYSWVLPELDRKPYKDLVTELESRVLVEDLTDPNDDVAVQISLSAPSGLDWHLWLSLVGRFGVLVRSRQEVAEVITRANASPDEEWMLALMESAGVELIAREVLEIPLDMPMFNVLEGRVRMFNGLFSDVDMLPWSGENTFQAG